MVIPHLAYRNILGAGLRTWLNVIVLSFAFVAIIWTQGLVEGMNYQAATAVTAAEYAGGQYWHDEYDPYDPFTLQDAHGLIPEFLQREAADGKATPILVVQGSAYPKGRLFPVLLKGLPASQTLLAIPTEFLQDNGDELPALIGTRMAKLTGLNTGDFVTLQWRDVNGTFDARDAKIVEVMKTSVPTIDNGQIWLPLAHLQEMTNMPGEATLITVAQSDEQRRALNGWNFRSREYLLKDIRQLIQSKTVGSAIMYVILLLLAMLAIFDTQVLSIFRRRKEMGTLMALGLTRSMVIRLFTLEGALHGVMAAIVGALYGIPLLTYFAKTGWTLPEMTDSYGFAIGEKLFPMYSIGLIAGTTLIVLVITTIVSFMPTRKIAKLKPTDALRGKMS